jgi:hypothetical protein
MQILVGVTDGGRIIAGFDICGTAPGEGFVAAQALYKLAYLLLLSQGHSADQPCFWFELEDDTEDTEILSGLLPKQCSSLLK